MYDQREHVRPVFTKEQLDLFLAEQKRREDDADKLAKEAEEAGLTPDPVEAAFVGDNKVKQGTSLFKTFEKSLQYSSYFSADPEETKLKVVNPNPKIKNLTSFQIVVKLKKPIRLSR